MACSWFAACASEAEKADPDAGADADSDSDSETSTSYECHSSSGCCRDLDFPPSNGPDGCTRVLLSQIDGWAFSEGSTSTVAISRDGGLALFVASDCEEDCFGVYGLPEDINGLPDVYTVCNNLLHQVYLRDCP